MSHEQWTLAGTVDIGTVDISTVAQWTIGHWLAHALINPKLPSKQAAASWRSCSKAGKDKIAGQGKGAIIIIDLGQILQIS